VALHGTGAASQDEYDKATEDRDIFNAELQRANSAKIEAERQVQRAEQLLRYYEERLADTRLVAPFDGLIVRRLRDPGDVLVPGGSILELVSTQTLWVSAWVDETAMSGLAEGLSARAVFRSEPDQSYPGTVTRISPEADRESRELLVDVELQRLPPRWAIGQRVEVYIEAGQRQDVLTLPQRAITWRDKQAGVIFSNHGKARWRKVSLGLRGRDTVEIIQGLEAGQTVAVVSPGDKAPRDGRNIRLR
jgi:HlyD family secretion protein